MLERGETYFIKAYGRLTSLLYNSVTKLLSFLDNIQPPCILILRTGTLAQIIVAGVFLPPVKTLTSEIKVASQDRRV